MSLFLRVILSLSFLHLFSCSSTDKSSETPEGVFAIGQEFEKDERYEEAIRRYQEVKNKFPYSNWAAKAELAIADVHYKDEGYAEAQVAYQAFKELHPKHPQIDYVVYRIGMSFYKQVPDSIDRDLTLANDAIANFDDLIKIYPASEHLKEAREKRDECLKKLAGKEDYIGDFYFKREIYLSAFLRYENLVAKFYGHGFDAKALSRAAVAGHKSSHEDQAQKFLKRLQAEFPGSPELADARKVIE